MAITVKPVTEEDQGYGVHAREVLWLQVSLSTETETKQTLKRRLKKHLLPAGVVKCPILGILDITL